jgi:Cys-tRNA(Pro) deacylase
MECNLRGYEMAEKKTPATSAVRVLHCKKVVFSNHLYDYQEKGGTSHPSHVLGLDEHSVIKTLVMEDDGKNPMLVLMHGDRQVSTKDLARFLGSKSVSPCSPETAHRHTGYMVGGTSPFGTRKKMPVYMEATILSLHKIHINGGKRGYLVGLSPKDVERILKPVLVTVGIEG